MRNHKQRKVKASKARDSYVYDLSDDDWDGYNSDFYSDYEDDMCGEYLSKRNTLTVDLQSVIKPRRQTDSKGKRGRRPSDTLPTLPTKTCLSPQINEDPLQFMTDIYIQPNLVRSTSWPRCVKRHSPTSTPWQGSVATGETIREDFPCTILSNPAIHCFQLILPVRQSVVGPVPQSSLPIFSDKWHVAVLLVWSMDKDSTPRVLPLIGSSTHVVDGMQRKLVERLCPAQEQSQGTACLAYWNLSTKIAEGRAEWTALLESLLQEDSTIHPFSSPQERFKSLSLGCQKAGISLGECVSQYDLLKDLCRNEDTSRETNSKDQHNNISLTDANNKSCFICFDEIDTECRLLPCQHATCLSCCRAYLKSAADSGQSSIRCSAHKCNVTLNFLDTAHILMDDHVTFQRMVQFALERNAVSTPETRFCPLPNCRQLLRPTSSSMDLHHPGFRSMLCDCGTVVCGDCTLEAHPGVSCPENERIRANIDSGKLDSGKLDSELANVAWVLQNSRPCPTCKFPIEKNGGCNHMRCQRCNYYFCFMCGGEGDLCDAYSCKQAHSYWHEKPEYSQERHDGLDHLVQKFHAYRKATENRLSSTQYLANHTGLSASDTEELLLKIQCNQVLQWWLLRDINSVMNGYDSVTGNPTLHLELALSVFPLRCKSRHARSTKTGHAMRIAERMNLSTFEQVLVHQEVEEMLTQLDDPFFRKVHRIVLSCIQALKPPSAVKNCPRHEKKRASKVKDVMNLPLNERQSRSRYPWRNGLHRDDDDDKDDWNDDDTNRAAMKGRHGRSKKNK